jgi:hypothetical protein
MTAVLHPPVRDKVPCKLGSAESDMLVALASEARMMIPETGKPSTELSSSEIATCRRLAKKYLVDIVDQRFYKVNQAGLERAKQIY